LSYRGTFNLSSEIIIHPGEMSSQLPASLRLHYLKIAIFTSHKPRDASY